MQIFLSFASEQQDVADSIVLALRERGHEVFFSHDGLPPGSSFNDRIQTALARSDLLIFLISPESVTKGRYTLTELAFARAQWRSPKNRVLPVMVAPTPMLSVPTYLKAVSVLEPEGNVAAETAAQADKLLNRSRLTSLLVFASLGIGTGILSFLSYRYAHDFLRFSFFFGPEATSVAPGILFAFLVGACLYHHDVRDKFLLFVAVLFTIAAWTLAYDATVATYSQLSQFSKTVRTAENSGPIGETRPQPDREASGTNADDRPEEKKELIPVLAAMSGIAGGLVGGAITVFAVMIASPAFRRLDSCIITLAVATVLGALLEAFRLGESIGPLMLFTLWQSAVISCIVRGLAFADTGG
jgi:hypothetical protein